MDKARSYTGESSSEKSKTEVNKNVEVLLELQDFSTICRK